MKSIVSGHRSPGNGLAAWTSAFALFLAALGSVDASAGSSPCAGLVLETAPGSQSDDGWSGVAHGIALPSGTRTSWDVLKRCSNDQEPCADDGDCGGGDCVATCDCESDTTCEITGPVHGSKCISTMTDCTTNADCPASAACVPFFGPPQPYSAAATPFCALSHFEGEAGGAFDTESGDASLSASLKRRTFLGISASQPCPRCGPPDQGPEVGDMFTCEGGQFPGAPCTVEGVTPFFGGTSSDCPPSAANNITGLGSAVRFRDLTTGSVSRTAGFPCASFGLQGNPLSPGSNPKCIDDTAGPVCSSNADCRRCTGDPEVACSSNGDCTGKGACAEAPDQPVTCGYWCHCGFCDGSASLPCFDSSECPNGQACVKGAGVGNAANSPQQKPNGCAQDGSLCGGAEVERCESSEVGSCSLAPFRTCSSDFDCEIQGAGACTFENKSCFESRIERAGTPSPLGLYCAFEDKACSSNADCSGGEGDFCVADASRPRMVGVFCLPATTSGTVNTALGFTGPSTVDLEGFVQVCRCSGSEPGCEDVCGGVTTTTTTSTTTTSTTTTTTSTTTTSTTTTTTTTLPGAVCGNGVVTGNETCDDGDTTWVQGEHCNAQCKALACGDTNDSGTITTSDAQFTLRASVGTATCSTKICDTNGSGSVTTTDALLVLRKGVGQEVNLNCPS